MAASFGSSVLQKRRRPDFIGIGAQKAGTSWIFACLQEHPQIFFPMKEVHFFSRQRNWCKGYEWYEMLFAQCPEGSLAGEFSTSYLCDDQTPRRIAERYPEVKLIACLRHPVDRAYSNYLNDIKAGNISKDSTFERALGDHPEYIDQGKYGGQLRNYLEFFSLDQVLILIYEDIYRDEIRFIRRIFDFLRVDSSFEPDMVYREINKGYVPRYVFITRVLQLVSRILYMSGLGKAAWLIKRSGIPNSIHTLNSRKRTGNSGLNLHERAKLFQEFKSDIKIVEGILGRCVDAWHE